MIKRHILTTILAFLLMPVSAFATVIGGNVTGGDSGGVFQLLNPPPVIVGDDNQQSPNLFAFNEDQNISILAPLTVNIGTDPVAGNVVASHYIFFDPGPSQRVIGYVDFDADIFGIMTLTAELAASDFLANNLVNYQNPGLRGLEGGDTATIHATLKNRVLIDFTASTPGDYIRVLTMRSPRADVPEPAMIGLLGLGAFGIFALRRRKQS